MRIELMTREENANYAIVGDCHKFAGTCRFSNMFANTPNLIANLDQFGISKSGIGFGSQGSRCLVICFLVNPLIALVDEINNVAIPSGNS